jgi:hypothetical protein
MSWEFLKVKRFQMFGRLKVVDCYDRPGWVQCVCRCGNYLGVLERKLLSGETSDCTSCTARIKFEGLAKEG